MRTLTPAQLAIIGNKLVKRGEVADVRAVARSVVGFDVGDGIVDQLRDGPGVFLCEGCGTWKRPEEATEDGDYCLTCMAADDEDEDEEEDDDDDDDDDWDDDDD